jgi:hypothetical protein
MGRLGTGRSRVLELFVHERSLMSSSSDPKPLNSHHRDTLIQLFQHPTSHNIEWNGVLSLLEAVGTVAQLQDGRYSVTLGAETEVIDRPRDKDIDVQQIVDLRRMLTNAGYGTPVGEMEAKGKGV